jgi:hypothetical protein
MNFSAETFSASSRNMHQSDGIHNREQQIAASSFNLSASPRAARRTVRQVLRRFFGSLGRVLEVKADFRSFFLNFMRIYQSGQAARHASEHVGLRFILVFVRLDFLPHLIDVRRLVHIREDMRMAPIIFSETWVTTSEMSNAQFSSAIAACSMT